MTPETFRGAGHQIVDWIADFRDQIERYPVRSKAAPGDVARQLPAGPPSEPESMAAILADLDQIIVPSATHPQHPGYLAFFPANVSLSSMLGDFVSTGLGQLGITWESSPALTELEEVMCEWMRQLYGLPGGWRGTIHDTASTAALVAMLAARERASSVGFGGGGLQAEPQPLVVYASMGAHSSVQKAAVLAGFGIDNVRLVETDDRFGMRPDRLEAIVRADIAAGLKPSIIVATVGTTGTTAVDPLPAIASIARENSIWLHVDAAMAGSAMVLPECGWMFEGVEQADSVSTNPHKWMGTALDCSLFFVRDHAELTRFMSTNPSYLQSSADGTVTQYRDWGIPLGRRFRALKLWFQLRLDGVDEIRSRLRRDMEHARRLAAQAEGADGWRVLAPVVLQTVCLRHEPPGLDPEQLDMHTLRWAEAINDSGEFYVTPALLEGRWMVRVSFGSLLTERRHAERFWELCQQVVAAEQFNPPG